MSLLPEQTLNLHTALAVTRRGWLRRLLCGHDKACSYRYTDAVEGYKYQGMVCCDCGTVLTRYEVI